ncbi:MAG: hypothetical protein ACC653_04565 [Gammaproteobacteria bacterium]
MKSYFIYIVVLAPLLFSTNTYAEETTYGLGASINSSPTIYFPINTKNYIFEPSFSLSVNNIKPDSESTATDFTSDDYNLGLGVFKKSKITNKTIIYYGVRGGYFTLNRKYIRTNSSSQVKWTGFYIAPTLGAEYFLSLKFSAGLDFSIEYANFDVKDTSTSNGIPVNDSTNNTYINTKAEIIFRYHF